MHGKFYSLIRLPSLLRDSNIATNENNDMLELRPIKLDDVEALLDIERDNSMSPWNEKQFRDAKDYIYVLTLDYIPVGYIALSYAADQAELQNLSVGKAHQNLGFGKKLLNHALGNLPNSINQIFLEVRVSNFRAIRLYTVLGFNQVGYRRDYYPTEFTREDALVMELQLKNQ